MTNKYKIGDLVRIPTIDVKRDAEGQVVKKWNSMARCYLYVETKVWTKELWEVVAVPDQKRKRYTVQLGDHKCYYNEKSLAAA